MSEELNTDLTLESMDKEPKRDVTAEWRIPIKGKLHKIQFEHGTASGKRVLWINDKEIFRRDWMFKLVGDDTFTLDDIKCVIRVDPLAGFKYKYSLLVDGKSYEQFKENQAKAMKTWETVVNCILYRIALEKSTMNIFVNGRLVDENGEFVDGGTDTTFYEGENTFVLSIRTSGNKREGLIHTLKVNGIDVPELLE
ncbi:Fas apoptotic inhibitory molecule 1 [Pseudolycoriella hygida]|uniref:Fas apoptotic inhibitory molecule 1 n=1 Tax=Pseudolycoriella hygida TaxID=35572 RepID=A0A9Q0NE19_9DIPT|nr:Fas apoptotic inhibitory molecule 1 [Pseudolycoriella hygida]